MSTHDGLTQPLYNTGHTSGVGSGLGASLNTSWDHNLVDAVISPRVSSPVELLDNYLQLSSTMPLTDRNDNHNNL